MRVGHLSLILMLGTAGSLYPARTDSVTAELEPVRPVRFPCEIVDRAGDIVSGYVGGEFFSRYVYFVSIELNDRRGAITRELWRTGGQTPHVTPMYEARPEVYYKAYWEIRFPSGGRGHVMFDMDPDGHLLSDPRMLHLPNCVESPGSCEFSITAERAIQVAESADLPPGKSGFREFRWCEMFDRYVWVVEHCPSALEEPHRAVLVDANTGEVLHISVWDGRGPR